MNMFKWIVVLAAVAAGSGRAIGADDEDTVRAEMQRALNNEVAASSFNAGDIKKAEAYSEQAKKQNIPPVMQPPAYWTPGWTCGSLMGYRYYVYNDYRNCVYYHHHYGRYW